MSRSYIYTETAFHHEGDVDYLKKLVDASKDAGADGIKFQVLTQVNDVISSRHKAYKQLAGYCLSLAAWKEVFAYTRSKQLDIIMMPLNRDSLALCSEFPIRYLDIHSVSFHDHTLLKAIQGVGLEVILGVGGRTEEEIRDKKEFFGRQLKVLMVGFQAFPSRLETVRIGKIAVLRQSYPDLLIGYADHSAFDHEHAIISNDFARIMGATIFEKHITITEGVERVDFSAAVSAGKLRQIVERIRFLDEYVMTGYDEAFRMDEPEVVYRNRQLRCVAVGDLGAGTKLRKEDIALKLYHEQENVFSIVDDLVGKTLARPVANDEPITTDSII